jgi:predicted ATP-dependent protease
MPGPRPLPLEVLYRPCDPTQFGFETTDGLDAAEGIVGQRRALEALAFGTGIRSRGYNIYVLGATGVGKKTVVRKFLREKAIHAPKPSDWCYLHNFDQPDRPRLLRLDPGVGEQLRHDLDRLIERLRTVMPSCFEDEDYQRRLQAIKQEYQRRQQDAVKHIENEADEQDIALIHTPGEMSFAPRRKGEVMEPEAFHSLPRDERERVEAEIDRLQDKLQGIAGQFPKWRTEMQDRVRELNQRTVEHAAAPFLEEIRDRYRDHPDVCRHIFDLGADLIERQATIASAAEEDGGQERESFKRMFDRYRALVLVDNSECEGAPVVYHDFPTHQHLVGRVDHKVRHGALVTDFSLIRAGALHRANGGYLILDADKVLAQPFAWESLKRALYAREVNIESPEQTYSAVSTVSLEPEPMPLDIKLVLLGDRLTYYLLAEHDPEFAELFKVQADFEDDLPRGAENDLLYARLIASIAKKEALLPLSREAVARVIEHGSRLCEDSERMSAHAGWLSDLLRESSYWAGQTGARLVQPADVQQAVDQQEYRARRIEEEMDRDMHRGTILIDTTGRVTGQINGLTVMHLGAYAFGRPVRITATTRLGSGQVVDIEREVELGGSIHSKGVLILTSYLGANYARDRSLSVNASLVFEQAYGEIDGDSASLAELCALLSELADLPISQELAVTGAVNQKGLVQAVGGVNEKIEGFFQVCLDRGLTGRQGVIIPESNVRDLMLDYRVRKAVAERRFNLYAVRRVDEAMELLTDRRAGKRRSDGRYPEKSINGRVEARLEELAKLKQAESESGSNDEEGDE